MYSYADLLQVVDDQVAPFERLFGREVTASRFGYFAIPQAHFLASRKSLFTERETPYIKTC